MNPFVSPGINPGARVAKPFGLQTLKIQINPEARVTKPFGLQTQKTQKIQINPGACVAKPVGLQIQKSLKIRIDPGAHATKLVGLFALRSGLSALSSPLTALSSSVLLAVVLVLSGCSSPAPQSKPAAVVPSTEFPWHIGVFQGEGRTKLALLPDGTMIFPPLYLGTYTFSNGDLTFTSSNKETTKKGKFTNSKEGLQLTLDERSYLLKSAVSFSRYSSSGVPLDVTPAALVGAWKKIAQSGAPLSDWQRASEALGPSLATEETLAFAASNQLTQTIGGTSRKETFTLTGGTIVRSPEIAGYQLTQEIRLYADRLELGPKESPDVYVRSNAVP